MLLNSILVAAASSIDYPAWIQAGAAVFAAVGLVWTLYLQKKATDAQLVATKDQLKVSKTQLEVAERDQRRFLNEIMPKIDLHYTYNPSTKRGFIECECTKNDAFRLCVENRSSEAIQITGGLYLPTDKSRNEISRIDFQVTDEELLNNWPHNQAPFIFIVYYRDAIDTKYASIFIKFFDNNPFKTSPATLLSEMPTYERLIIEDPQNRFRLRKITDIATFN